MAKKAKTGRILLRRCKLTDKDWADLKEAAGPSISLSLEHWDKIRHHMHTYSLRTKLYQDAPRISEIKPALEEIAWASKNLCLVMEKYFGYGSGSRKNTEEYLPRNIIQTELAKSKKPQAQLNAQNKIKQNRPAMADALSFAIKETSCNSIAGLNELFDMADDLAIYAKLAADLSERDTGRDGNPHLDDLIFSLCELLREAGSGPYAGIEFLMLACEKAGAPKSSVEAFTQRTKAALRSLK